MDRARRLGRILVVDDDPRIVRLIERCLSMQGHEVVTAYNGVEALQKIEQESPDLVLLDVMMPEMDGWTVLEKLRAQPLTMDLPVIILSALDQDRDLERGAVLGCDIYIPKPWETDVLLNAVQRMLEFSAEQAMLDDQTDAEGDLP